MNDYVHKLDKVHGGGDLKMKEKYSRPMIIDANATEGHSVVPFAAAAALVAGYAVGRAVAQTMGRDRTQKMPCFKNK